MSNFPEIQAVLDLFEDMGATHEALHHEKTMLLADPDYLIEQLEFYKIPTTIFAKEIH
jgi:hypothetical protein